MKGTVITPARQRELVRRINALHAQAERHRNRCREEVYEALRAAWQAGHLLLDQKRGVAHGNWVLWLETHFKGTVRTAQRYMLLAKRVADVSHLRGLTLRQAYLRLGVVVATDPHQGQGIHPVLPVHARLANRFHRWARQKGDSTGLPEQEKHTLRRDLRPLYEWLDRLFAEANERPKRRASR